MNAKIYYIILIIASLSVPSLTVAQSLNFATGNNDQPIEITADNGIEWQRDNQIMVGNRQRQGCTWQGQHTG